VSAAVNIAWYAVFYAFTGIAGWALAHTNSGEQNVWTGMVIAVIAGPLFAQLSKLARRWTVDKHSVRVELDDFRFSWLWSTFWVGGALIGAWAVADQLFGRRGVVHAVQGADAHVASSRSRFFPPRANTRFMNSLSAGDPTFPTVVGVAASTQSMRVPVPSGESR